MRMGEAWAHRCFRVLSVYTCFQDSKIAHLPLSLSLTPQEPSVLERGRWMEGEVPCPEFQGLTGGQGLSLGWGKLAQVLAPKRQVHTAWELAPWL